MDINKHYKELSDIYHSNDAHAMQIKADLYCIDLNDLDVIEYLIFNTAYHNAYWPHTAKRFTAFINILKTKKNIVQFPGFESLLLKVKSEINRIKSSRWAITTSGGKQHIKNLKTIFNILKSFKKA